MSADDTTKKHARFFACLGNPFNITAVLLFASSLLIALLCNIYIFNEGESISFSVYGWVCSGLLTFAIFLLALKVPYIGWVLFPIAAAVAFVAYMVDSIFGIFISYEIIASMIEGNSQEAADYITFGNIAAAILLLAATFSFLYFGKKHLSKKLSYPLLLIALLAYGCSIIPYSLLSKDVGGPPDDVPYLKGACFWPITDIRTNYKRIKEYFKKGGKQYHDIMKLPSLAQKQSSCLLSESDEMTVVLHIGESVRSDHLQLNGYHRETTPRLSSLSDNIITFPDNYSFGRVTRVSIVGILTDAASFERKPGHQSFIDLFNFYGFHSSSILTNPHSFHDFPLKTLTSTCKERHIIEECVDGEHLLSSTVETFKAADRQSNCLRKLHVIYDSGAHPFFESRPKSKKFLPDGFTEETVLENLDHAINAYDNNLVEIDWEVSSIINQLKDRVSVYMFVADHGIALGEDGMFGQGNPSPSVMKPAFFIWLSDPFIKKYPDLYRNLAGNKDKCVSHDYVLHTILSLSGISVDTRKKDFDLTNPNVKEFVLPPNAELMMESAE